MNVFINKNKANIYINPLVDL